MSEPAFIGLDAGGTRTRGVLLVGKGRVTSLARPTDGRSEESVLRALLDVIRDLREYAGRLGVSPLGLGVGIAGYIDHERGVVTESPNLPLRDLPLRDLLGRETGLPTVVDNDANCAALAENRLGAGRGCRHQVHLTLGTGIGGGIIIGGELYRGASGSAAELGHIIVLEGGPQTACGHGGCLEALASGSAVEREAKLLMEEGWMPLGVKVKGSELNAADVAAAARAGDPAARTLWERMGHFLGVGMACIINALNPERLTLSGGLTEAWDLFSEPMMEGVSRHAVPLSFEAVRILTSELGDWGGAIGAAILSAEAAH